jgi:hypothetical protein
MRMRVVATAKKEAEERARMSDPMYALRTCINDVEVYFCGESFRGDFGGVLSANNPHALADAVFADDELLAGIKKAHEEALTHPDIYRGNIVSQLKPRLYEYYTGKPLPRDPESP